MHKLKKPLTNVCNVTEHHKPIFKWIWRCKFQPTKSDPWEAVAFTDKVSKEALIYVFQQIGDTTPSEPAADAEEITDDSSPRPPAEPFFGIQRVRNDSFLSLPLSDPAIKFAVRLPSLHTPLSSSSAERYILTFFFFSMGI